MLEFTERPINLKEMREFEDCARQGILLIGAKSNDEPSTIVEGVERHIDRLQAHRLSFISRLIGDKQDKIQLALALGAVWGYQLVRQFEWEWTCVFNNDLEWYCVANEDRSMVTYPTYFVRDCLNDPKLDCTASLAFNMLKEPGAIPVQAAKSYTNIMDCVHRIVPKAPAGRR